LPTYKVSINRGRLRSAKSVQAIFCGYNFNMSSITFEQFKSYFEFVLEVSGVVGGIGAVIYKVDGLNAI
jgi:hypothetical protein